MLYFDIVFAVLRNMEFEKQEEHRLSPEYFLEYAAVF
jgi:hypothetical protein